MTQIEKRKKTAGSDLDNVVTKRTKRASSKSTKVAVKTTEIVKGSEQFPAFSIDSVTRKMERVEED